MEWRKVGERVMVRGSVGMRRREKARAGERRREQAREGRSRGSFRTSRLWRTRGVISGARSWPHVDPRGPHRETAPNPEPAQEGGFCVGSEACVCGGGSALSGLELRWFGHERRVDSSSGTI